MRLKPRKLRLFAPVTALAVTAIILLSALAAPRWADQIDYGVFDTFQLAKPRTYDPDAPVRIVDIDRASLAALGQWPWPRTYLAEMVERLTALGAATIAFDIVFAEADRTSPERVLASWQRFSEAQISGTEALPDHDEIFAAAVADAPVVLGTILSAAPDEPEPKGSLSVLGPPALPLLPRFAGAELNLPLLQSAAQGLGSVTLVERAGGTVRAVPLLARAGDAAIPGLSVEALRTAQGAPGLLVKTVGASGERGFGAEGIVSLRVGGLQIPTRADGSLWLRLAGADPRRRLSAADLLGEDWRDLESEVAGRIMIVGASAPGLRDLVATPLSDSQPGAEIHAEAIEQIVAQDFLTRPDWAKGAELLALIVGGVLIAITAAAASATRAALGVIAWCAGCIFGAWHAFDAHALLLSPFWPVLGAVSAWSAGSAANYLVADREKRQIRAQFSQFLAPDVVEEIAENPERFLTPRGEDREITILFIDVRSFSSISEGMSPQELILYLNDFLTPISDVIIAEGGTIDKYIGDAVMAFWNAPKPRADHRAKALDAVLAIRAAVAELNERHRAAQRPEIAFGAGLNTGICSVGAIGSYRRLDYTCIGDAVNAASRFEGLTKQYGLDACLSQPVAQGAAGHALIEIDSVAVVGRAQSVERIYALLGDAQMARSAPFLGARDCAGEALSLYRAGQFEAAAEGYRRLAALCPALAAYADVMIARAESYAAAPPDHWDGVHRATSK